MDNVRPIEIAKKFQGRLHSQKASGSLPDNKKDNATYPDITGTLLDFVQTLVNAHSPSTTTGDKERLDRIMNFIDVETYRKGIPLIDLVMMDEERVVPSQYLRYLVQQAPQHERRKEKKRSSKSFSLST